MKNILITFLLSLFTTLSFAQGTYYMVPNTNNLRTYFGNRTFDGSKFVVYAVNGDEYKSGTKGGLFRYCDTCLSAVDDSNNIYRQPDVEVVYVRLTTSNYTTWTDTTTILSYVKSYLASLQTQVNNMLPSPTANNNKVMVVNGTGTGYVLSNASALITGVNLSNPSGNNMQTGLTFLSGSPVNSSTLSVPTGFGWADPTALGSGDRALNTAYQVSTTKYAIITVSAKISCNLSLSGGQTGSVTLQKSANGTSGWAPNIPIDGSNTGTLTIGLNTTQISGAPMTTILKPGEYWRLVPSGNCTTSFNGGEQRVAN